MDQPVPSYHQTVKQSLLGGGVFSKEITSLEENSSSQTGVVSVARECVAKLAAEGVNHPLPILLAGLRAMTDRSIAEHRKRGATPAHLATVVRNGGPWSELPTRRESPSELYRAMNGMAG